MGMSRRSAIVLTVAGLVSLVAGVALVYPPAGLIVLGLVLAYLGLFGVDVT